MSIYEETVETGADATSVMVATFDIPALLSTADSYSVLVGGASTDTLLVNTAASTSSITFDQYSMLIEPATAASHVFPAFVVTGMAESGGTAFSRTVVELSEQITESASVVASIPFWDVPILLVSSATATDTLAAASTIADASLTSRATATVRLELGMQELAVNNAAATIYVDATRVASALVLDAAAATTVVLPTNIPQIGVVVSAGSSQSSVEARTDWNPILESSVRASSGVYFKDPTKLTWVMNTETGAVSWYNNYDFNSIIQVGGVYLATSADGLYELHGDTDSGEVVDAELVSGYLDFGTPQTKRLENAYFGYTSEGQLALTVETNESEHAAATYWLEPRDASSPRNSRISIGKGLYGRYWRTSITNVDGADFEIHDATLDIAVSTRRV